MRYLLLGGGGILGSGFQAVLQARGSDFVRLRPPWGDVQGVRAAMNQALPSVLADDAPLTVLWAAGAGSVGAAADVLKAETTALADLCALLRPEAQAGRDLTVVLASSAGALFAGAGGSIVDEHTQPQPITPYGREKLVQEELVRHFAEVTGARAVACRYSNLYGLADGWLTPRGLVSVAVRATRLRQPITIFVSADTRRDLVYNRDAAALSLRLAADSRVPFGAALVVDGTTRTVGEILSVIRAVSGRRVPATYAERPETRFQPRVLRFARPRQGADTLRRTPMEAAVHLMMRAPMSA